MSSIDEQTPLLTTPKGPEVVVTSLPLEASTEDSGGDESNESNVIEEERQYQSSNRKRLYHVFPALAIGSFLAAADQTIVVSSHSKIGTELGALDKTSWLATGYVEACVTFAFFEILLDSTNVVV